VGERTLAWRVLLLETESKLEKAGVSRPDAEARWLVERASGHDGADLVLALDDPATERGVAHLDAMVERRVAGEPLQYVLGAWSFRTLDLYVDRRVLIPRPETEVVVEHALRELDRIADMADHPVVVDLGTGSGAIGLDIAAERPSATVWVTDSSADALDVARANVAGSGRSGTRVRVAEGSWFHALPAELEGAVDLAVSNPPYIADREELPFEVDHWEPRRALRAGPAGTEAISQILDESRTWLVRGGAVVVELSPAQAEPMSDAARRLGFVDVRIEPDLNRRPRVLIARTPAG
jgi:release factor glutamine methyltransferase